MADEIAALSTVSFAWFVSWLKCRRIARLKRPATERKPMKPRPQLLRTADPSARVRVSGASLETRPAAVIILNADSSFTPSQKPIANIDHRLRGAWPSCDGRIRERPLVHGSGHGL